MKLIFIEKINNKKFGKGCAQIGKQLYLFEEILNVLKYQKSKIDQPLKSNTFILMKLSLFNLNYQILLEN